MNINYLPNTFIRSRGPLVSIVVALLLLVGSAAHAQAPPAWQTAMAATGNFSAVQAIAADANGNVYLTGEFSGTVNFGSIALTEAGDGDLFVAKWNSANNSFVWAQRAGGPGFNHPQAIAVNGSSVYVAGEIVSASAKFGSGTVTVSNSGNSEVFVAKLTDAGSSADFTWVQQTISTRAAVAYGLAVSGTSVYITGGFGTGTSSFGTTRLTNSSNSSTFNFDIFTAKLTDYGTSGSFVWASRAGGANSDYGLAVAVNGSAVYVTGSFASPTAGFGSVTLTNTNPDGSNDAFVTKLTDTGTSSIFGWTQQVGGTGNEIGYGIAASGTGVYVAGLFNSGSISLGSTTLATVGLNDAFVAKLTDAGSTASYTWAQRAGGTGNDFASSLAVNGTSVYIAGSFSSTAAAFGGTNLAATGTGTSDAFVAKLTDTGSGSSFAWAQQAGGTGNDYFNGVAVQGTFIYVGGMVTPPASFGSQTITSAPTGYGVGVVASIMDTQALAATLPAKALGIELYPNPTSAKAMVILPPVPGANQATFTLTDALGRVVRARTAALPAAGLQYPLDLAGLLPGVYALQVQAGTARAVRQLVID